MSFDFHYSLNSELQALSLCWRLCMAFCPLYDQIQNWAEYTQI